MIINKTTSNALLVSTLVVTDDSGKPVKNVTEFDTDTLVATLSVGGPVTAVSFTFIATSEEDATALYGLLDDEFEPRVVMSERKYKAKKAMDDTASPDDYLVFNSFRPALRMYVAACTNCSTKFLLYIDDEGEIWSGEKGQASDTFQALTQVNGSGLTCDNCGNDVALLDESPR